MSETTTSTTSVQYDTGADMCGDGGIVSNVNDANGGEVLSSEKKEKKGVWKVYLSINLS